LIYLLSLMAIVNVTPDSFSDGGSYQTEEQFQIYLDEVENDVHYLDLGAESTRPGATLLKPKEEIERLKPFLKTLNQRYHGKTFRPQISVDTRQGDVATWALENGADIINDVSGLTCKTMKALLKKEKFKYVLMHSLSVPADPKNTLDSKEPTVPQLQKWFSQKLDEILDLGVEKSRLILDPGVGFGKTARQSLEIMQDFQKFWCFDIPILIGHSRKSFLSTVTAANPKERDFESTGVSVKLVDRGVEILRVHNPLAHKRACLAAGLLDR
ncbi:MAG: dihydropteroate synthase, partial [Pseudobdellovibrionaceae bacterium]